LDQFKVFIRAFTVFVVEQGVISFSAFAAFVAAADADEHVGGFDDRADFEPFFQAERFHGLFRDDGNDFRSAGERDDDFGIDRAGGYFFDPAGQLVAGADLHKFIV
jgi:hypothetical protein